MMESQVMIEMSHVSKQYRLGAIGGTTLKEELQSKMAKMRGREDPNLKVDQNGLIKNEKFWALKDVSFQVRKGEAVGIIGHNGAGKSTLLKLLSRVTAPTEGMIGLNGRIAAMLEVGTGFHPELTGRENIYMNGAILGMTKSEIDKKIEDIIEFSEVRRFIDTPVKRYSSGMYVKLAFSVAAHLDSEIMVMDEVLAVGDMKFQQKCLGKMGDAADNAGKTILYVSHNMSTIRQLCSRCIVLKKGKIIFDGNVEEAIRIYMDVNISEYKVKYDLANAVRPSTYHGSLFKIEEFIFVGKQEAVYFSNELLVYQFAWKSYDDFDELYIRLEIRDWDDGQPVGMAQSESFGGAKKGQVGITSFSFDISNLVEGRYFFEIDVYARNEFGAFSSYDHPDQQIVFQVMQEAELETINWQKKCWGKIRLNKMRFLSNKKVEDRILLNGD